MRGHVFGAFRECSRDVHALLHETAAAASAREWRKCGATSADAARAAYTAVLRRRWLGLHGRARWRASSALTRVPRWRRGSGGDRRRAQATRRPASTLATPRTWPRSSSRCSAAPPLGSAAVS